MRLRLYQEECIETMIKHFEKNKRQIVQLPTGSGKTFIFLKYLSENSKRSLIVVPTKDLCEQVYENSQMFFKAGDVYMKKRSYMCEANHYIVTAQSLPYKFMREWIKDQEFDHIVIDEAHRAYSDSYRDFLSHYHDLGYEPNILGFTATPERYDKKPLLDIFGDLTYDKTFNDLIDMGHLCDVQGYRIKTKDKLPSLGKTNRDFRPFELRNLDNDSRNNMIMNVYKQHCVDKKTLVFCLSVDHAKRLSIALNAEGFNAAAVYGDMPYEKRKRLLNLFKVGEIDVLCNCQLLTEGFDEPSIENLIIARPTRSKSLYCQMIGRAVRLFPGKEVANVYEFTDNCHDICTFDVAAGGEPGSRYQYKDGQRISEIFKELQTLNFEEVEIEADPFSFFEKRNNYLNELPANDRQLHLLNKKRIPIMWPISFLEAGYLLWKEQLKEMYGFNK